MDIFKNIFSSKKESSPILYSLMNIIELEKSTSQIIIANSGAILLKPTDKVQQTKFHNDINNYTNTSIIEEIKEFNLQDDSHNITWAILKTETSPQLVHGIDKISNYVATLNMGDKMIGSVFIAKFHETKAYIICNYRTSKFYPFIPSGKESRNNELELDLGHLLDINKIPIENHINWYPLWGALI
tara:strand:- start:42 stop:599 length:558 start_codon:yes stop_codon:yes gene_type:complete